MRRGDAMNKTNIRELVSALADGQLQGEEFARGVEAATLDPVGREAWLAYHLIGDVLRSGELGAGARPDDFLRALNLSLQQEQKRTATRPSIHADLPVAPSRPAANDGSFRWTLVAAVASIAAVGAIAWSMVGGAP